MGVDMLQYDKDMNGEFSALFMKLRTIIMSYEGIKEIKNAKQTSYRDVYCRTVVMMRNRGDVFVVAFTQGANLMQKYPFLEGCGKIVRHLYFKTVDDVDESLLREMIEESLVLNMEAVELNKLKKR